jgi:hypothetical protein
MAFGLNLGSLGQSIRDFAIPKEYDGGDWDENPQAPLDTEIIQESRVCTPADIYIVLEMVYHTAIREKHLADGSVTDLVIQVFLPSFVGGVTDSIIQNLDESLRQSLNYESLRTVVRSVSMGDVNLTFVGLEVKHPERPVISVTSLLSQTFEERFMNQNIDPYTKSIDLYLASIGSQLLHHGFKKPEDAFKANQVISLLSDTPICLELSEAIITRMSMSDIEGAALEPLNSVFTDQGIIQDFMLCIKKASK